MHEPSALVDLGQVLLGARVDADLGSGLNEQGDRNHGAGLKGCGLGAGTRRGVALDARRAGHDLQVHVQWQVARDALAVVEHELADGALLDELSPVVLPQASLLVRLLVLRVWQKVWGRV